MLNQLKTLYRKRKTDIPKWNIISENGMAIHPPKGLIRSDFVWYHRPCVTNKNAGGTRYAKKNA